VLSLLGTYLWTVTKWRLQETPPVERRSPANIRLQLRNYGAFLRDRYFVGYMLTQGIMIAGIFAYVSGTPFIYQNICSPTSCLLEKAPVPSRKQQRTRNIKLRIVDWSLELSADQDTKLFRE